MPPIGEPDQRVALVTGASRGIGRSIALALAQVGIRTALTYHTRQDLTQQVVDSIRSGGGRAIAEQMSLEEASNIKSSIGRVRQQLGPIDILVNNAAIAQEKPFEALTQSDWDFMMAVNLRGAFICCQEALPQMLESGWGRIINIVSIGGQWGGLNQVHYAAAKAALISLTRSLGRLYSDRGITANAVSPGLVQTDMASRELNSKEGREKVRGIPIGRTATTGEIAQVVTFLASEGASYVTGQTVNVNGGMYFG